MLEPEEPHRLQFGWERKKRGDAPSRRPVEERKEVRRVHIEHAVTGRSSIQAAHRSRRGTLPRDNAGMDALREDLVFFFRMRPFTKKSNLS
jgi:hypothetical protein